MSNRYHIDLLLTPFGKRLASKQTQKVIASHIMFVHYMQIKKYDDVTTWSRTAAIYWAELYDRAGCPNLGAIR